MGEKRERGKEINLRKSRADGNAIYTTPTAILQEAKKPRRRMKNKGEAMHRRRSKR